MLVEAALIRRLIIENTDIVSGALVPELPLRLATKSSPLMTIAAESPEALELGEPFWAFAWAGGQGVARYILDNPALVEGKRVLDIATGSGLIALAAAVSGARQVTANDIDPVCKIACEVNAELNKVSLLFDSRNLIGSQNVDADVVFAGDICYEQPLASQVLGWFKALANQGIEVYVGDPGRASFSRDGLECVARYGVDTTAAWDDEDVRRAKVFQVLPQRFDSEV